MSFDRLLASNDRIIQLYQPGPRYDYCYFQTATKEEGGDASVQASLDLITNFSQGTMDPKILALYSQGSKPYKNLWKNMRGFLKFKPLLVDL